MRANPWYFDPIQASRQKQPNNKQSKNNEQSRNAGSVTTTKAAAATTAGSAEILDLISAMNNVAQGKATASSVQNILLTARDGGTDFMLGASGQQGSWGNCYALSSMFSMAKNLTTTALDRIKSLFTITSTGDIQVTFAKNINGNPFTTAQTRAGLNKQVIKAADLKYLSDNNLSSKSSESFADVITLAYGKMMLDLKANKKVASTAAQAANAADGNLNRGSVLTSDVFMTTLGLAKAGYTNITTSVTDAALLNSIKNTIASKGAVTATTLATGSQLVASHVYSIVGVDANNNIIVHNPWGYDGLTGTIAADSNINDGNLTLTMAQFRANFAYTSSLPSS